MEYKSLVKGSHCFRCIHYIDFAMEEVPDDEDKMLIVCAFDETSLEESYREEPGTPEHELCSLFSIDRVYLEWRRKLYGRE
jgi:hypothetical protein